MAIMLIFLLDEFWIASTTYIVISLVSSLTTILMAMFIVAHYQDKKHITIFSAGLVWIGIISGFQIISEPGSNEYLWLNSIANIGASLLFLIYTFHSKQSFTRLTLKIIRSNTHLMVGIPCFALVIGILLMGLSNNLPALLVENHLSTTAWIIHSLPLVLYMVTGIRLYRQYLNTYSSANFLFVAIIIFLFQASEVVYIADGWGMVWWFWQLLRSGVNIGVLIFVLKEYIGTSNYLAKEVEERRKAEKKLNDAVDDWYNSFNSIEDSLLILNRNEEIENINNSGILLWRKCREEIIGQKYYLFIGKDDSDEYFPLKEVIEHISSYEIERYDETLDKHFIIKCSPFFNKASEITKFVILLRDITDRKKFESKEKELKQELAIASRLASIGEGAAGIAHDLNNPLTSVIGFSQMLMKMDLPDNLREPVEVINDSASRAAGIVEKLLTFARKRKPQKDFVDINIVAQSVVNLCMNEMRINNIKVETGYDLNLPHTMVNVGQIQQVFLNIMLNAQQAITNLHKKGKIFIQTRSTPDSIQILFSDDGPGIPQEDLNKIFNPFFSTKEEDSGTGLGLSISDRIIKDHGGQIHVESAVGQGTTFIIDLPLISEDCSEQAKPKQIITKIKPMNGARILVVDDEKNICNVLTRLLISEGYLVDGVNDAVSALSKIKDTIYNLILFDIKMPDMDGITFFEQLIQKDPSFSSKAICITGDVISARNKTFLENTTIPFVTKPFGIEEVTNTIALVLGGKTHDLQTTNSSS
ncbi:MAG: ATP-binding protein [Chloroflexi bacterium]|nr:ATP-binding protein [Chloroflexota bacterium]